MVQEARPISRKLAADTGETVNVAVLADRSALYLDQAENRQRIAAMARGGTVLGAFPYTAGFACHALVGGAAHARCIESSRDALAAARTNLALNGVADRAELAAGNAFDELRRLERAGARFDLVILDPPPFARTREATAAAARGYKEINLRAMRLLAPGGVLLTASCSFHVSRADFLAALGAAARDSGRRLTLLEQLGQGVDHPEVLTIPETGYLKGMVVRADWQRTA